MDEINMREIIAAYSAYKNREDDETFFSVIGRTYDEDLFSRLILKCLKDDPGAVRNLLTYCDKRLERKGIDKDGIYVDESRCEQVTENLSRVDIYVKGGNAAGERFALLVENKIGSWEHNEQTKTYSRWARSNHEEETVYCVFLKPSWNKSPSESKEFVHVEYKDLPDMFTLENRFIYELKLHIARHLEANKTMDPVIFEHSKELFEIVKELERKRSELGKEINEAIHKEITTDKLTEEHSPSYGVWRYYAKSLRWWNPNYRYYFYIEFKIGEGGDFRDICVQRTLKTYKDSASKLDEFMRVLNERPGFNKSTKVHSHYWVRKWDIKPQGEAFSPEWSLFVKEGILEAMKAAFAEQQEVVEAFFDWEKSE